MYNLEAILSNIYLAELKDIYKNMKYILDIDLPIKPPKNKVEFVKLFSKLFKKEYFLKEFKSIINDEKFKKLYKELIWDYDKIDTDTAKEEFNITDNDLPNMSQNWSSNKPLPNTGFLIKRYSGIGHDYLSIDNGMKILIKKIIDKPDGYYLVKFSNPQAKYSYSNEDKILYFIKNVKDLLNSNLININENTEKPTVKTLTFLRSSVQVNEFYEEKGLNLLSTDMLLRSFYFYNAYKRIDTKNLLDTLKDSIDLIFKDLLPFFITRMFVSHISGIRFTPYYTKQGDIFIILEDIINNMPKDDWVSVENILLYCKYRDFKIIPENIRKLSRYFFRDNEDERYSIEYNYYPLFFEPILRGALFYLASLGLIEILYDKPISNYPITARGKKYISIWDGLKYIKLTELGKYIFGFIKSYKPKKIDKNISSGVRFDEYKPIITIDKNNILLIGQLVSYVENIGDDRYILSYDKIFRNCINYKDLEVKIKNFYKLFDNKLPRVFDVFFNNIKENANLLEIKPEFITIELKTNKKLLNLFMTNKKLQKLIIKASGYKILVDKKDMPKLSKIVKENGFFVVF